MKKKRINKKTGASYRNCDDIFEALKPHLPEGCIVNVSDDMIYAGDRYYIKAIATISFNGQNISSSAFAREGDSPVSNNTGNKILDDSQCTGKASSYARKYALGGLLLLDDTKDADSVEVEDECENKQNSNSKQTLSSRAEFTNKSNQSAAAMAAKLAVQTKQQPILRCNLFSFFPPNKTTTETQNNKD